MSIDDALKQKITKLRLPEWGLPEDYIEIHITEDGYLGPWAQFYSPLNERVNGKNPIALPIWEMSKSYDWIPAAPPQPEFTKGE